MLDSYLWLFFTYTYLPFIPIFYDLIQLSDFMVSSIQKSRKRKLSSFTSIKKLWLILVRVVLSTCFFVVEEIIEAVSSIPKGGQKCKIKWIFELTLVYQ